MKKIITVIFFALVLLGITSESFSWDSTAAKFYPLAIGNMWTYQRTQYGNGTCTPLPITTTYTILITGDTVINNKKYFVFSNGAKERIDSATMNVYRFNGLVVMLDSLLARKNDHFVGGRIGAFTANCTVSDTGLYYFAGSQYRGKGISVSGNGSNNYDLAEGIGLVSLFTCFQNGYRDNLVGCIINGQGYGIYTSLHQISGEIPDHFMLDQNYPNPFNPTTNIGFRIAESGLVRIIVYDVLGREVQTLVNQELAPGTFEVDFDGSKLPSGVYYYKLESGSYTETKKMILIK